MSFDTAQDIIYAALDRAHMDYAIAKELSVATNLFNIRYQQICSMSGIVWPFLKDEKYISMSAPYTTGTVAITSGSATVTGTDTVWTKDMTGMEFIATGSTRSYHVEKVVNSTSLLLSHTFDEDTIAANEYTLYRNEYVCTPDWENVEKIIDEINKTPLNVYPKEYITDNYPQNYPQSSDPDKCACFERRSLTRITIDTIMNGEASATIADIAVDNWFATASSYGYVKKKLGSAYLYLQVLWGKPVNNETMTFYSDVGVTATGITCAVNEPNEYELGNVSGSVIILFDPPPYRAITYKLDVKLSLGDTLSGDEIRIPKSHRDILYNYVYYDLLGYQGKQNSAPDVLAAADNRVIDLMIKYGFRDNLRVTVVPGFKRRSY